MFRIERHALCGHGAPPVVFDLQLGFGVHGVLFPLDVRSVEQRADEELSKAVHACLKVLGLYVEEVIGVIGGRVRVR